jgi:hypothetical protein
MATSISIFATVERLSAMDFQNRGILAWKNTYKWMESMKGKRWKQFLSKQTTLVSRYIQDHSIEPLQKQIEQEFHSVPSYTHGTTIGTVFYEMAGSHLFLWNFVDQPTKQEAADLDIHGSHVWTVSDESSGQEQYSLCCWSKEGKEWTYKNPVAPFVAVIGNRCYTLELTNFLWMNRLVSVDARSGKDRQVLLELDNPEWNLQLQKGINGCLFVLGNCAGSQRLWNIDSHNALQEIGEGYEGFIPIGYIQNQKPSFFARRPHTQTYEPVGPMGKAVFPSFKTQTPELFDPFSHSLVTKQLGKRTVWDTKTGEKKTVILGVIEPDNIALWLGEQPTFTVAKPGAYRQYLTDEPLCPYAKSQYHTVKSKDRTSVPFVLIQNCKAKALLCVAYGAYGVPTHLTTDRWKPLIDRGWAICIALVRGSGDDTDAWADAARRSQKHKSVEDFEACIRAAQKVLHISPSETVLYGRSAGGYLVGATLSRHSHGDLFGAVYTEVPYVDVFSTTTNNTLPLTELEYAEFGDPLHRLENAQAVLRLSPVNSLPSQGAPRIFVLNRIGLTDKEVFAYESAKWIAKLQDLQTPTDAPKLLAITDGEGHFAPLQTLRSQRAQDLSILLSWLRSNKKSHQGIYNMVNTRKNNASRKNNRKNSRKNNVTMGGKRRKNVSRANRKSRRANRK